MIKRNKWKNKYPENSSDLGEIDFILVDSKKEDSFLEVRTASELIPQWFKDVPSKTKLRPTDAIEDLTVKRCVPVLDAFSTGYFLVTTEDYLFEYDPEKEVSTIKGGRNVQNKAVSMHPISQLGDMPVSDEFIKYAYKWGNQYLIKTPPGYSVLFTHPLNYHHLPFYSLSGVVDTDTYIMPVLFPFMMKNNFTGVIPAGTPVIQIIPFKRDDWASNVYDKMSKEFEERKNAAKDLYEQERYSKDGMPIGGMYKRDYRKKKKYL
jgi:hypothetical protein